MDEQTATHETDGGIISNKHAGSTEIAGPPARPGEHVLCVTDQGKIRPAIIIVAWQGYSEAYQDDECNLLVYPDGPNDGEPGPTCGLMWFGSVKHSQDTKSPGTWHWPAHRLEDPRFAGWNA